MRPDVPTPAALVVLDLLSRANDLATAATAAIDAGDHERLAVLLDDRQEVITGAIAAWKDTAGATRSPELVDCVARAAQSSVLIGQHARDAALRAREQVVAELSAFAARQHGSDGYQPNAPRGSYDVVL